MLAMRFLKNKNITTYYFNAASDDAVAVLQSELKAYITKKLGTNMGFSVSSVAEVMDTLGDITGTLTTMLAGIAGIL